MIQSLKLTFDSECPVTIRRCWSIKKKVPLTLTSRLRVSDVRANRSAALWSQPDILAFRRRTQRRAGINAQSFSHASTNTYYVSYMGVLRFSSQCPTHPHTPLTVSSHTGMLGIQTTPANQTFLRGESLMKRWVPRFKAGGISGDKRESKGPSAKTLFEPLWYNQKEAAYMYTTSG